MENELNTYFQQKLTIVSSGVEIRGVCVVH
jgi:hypothetical protein